MFEEKGCSLKHIIKIIGVKILLDPYRKLCRVPVLPLGGLYAKALTQERTSSICQTPSPISLPSLCHEAKQGCYLMFFSGFLVATFKLTLI